MFIITFMMCYIRARKNSNFIHKSLGFFFSLNGVKRSVIVIGIDRRVTCERSQG